MSHATPNGVVTGPVYNHISIYHYETINIIIYIKRIQCNSNNFNLSY